MSLLKSEPAAARRTGGSAAAATANLTKSRPDGSLPFKQAMELIETSISCSHAVITSTLPRGSIQIIQPVRVPEPLSKAYTREYHMEDRLTVAAIFGGKPVRSTDLLGENDHFVAGFLRATGLAYAAVAPLTAPVIDG